MNMSERIKRMILKVSLPIIIFMICFMISILFIQNNLQLPQFILPEPQIVTFFGIELAKVYAIDNGTGSTFIIEKYLSYDILPFLLGFILFVFVMFTVEMTKKWVKKKWVLKKTSP